MGRSPESGQHEHVFATELDDAVERHHQPAAAAELVLADVQPDAAAATAAAGPSAHRRTASAATPRTDAAQTAAEHEQ